MVRSATHADDAVGVGRSVEHADEAEEAKRVLVADATSLNRRG